MCFPPFSQPLPCDLQTDQEPWQQRPHEAAGRDVQFSHVPENAVSAPAWVSVRTSTHGVCCRLAVAPSS